MEKIGILASVLAVLGLCAAAAVAQTYDPTIKFIPNRDGDNNNYSCNYGVEGPTRRLAVDRARRPPPAA